MTVLLELLNLLQHCQLSSDQLQSLMWLSSEPIATVLKALAQSLACGYKICIVVQKKNFVQLLHNLIFIKSELQ